MQTVGNGSIGTGKPDKYLKGCFRSFQLHKGASCFHHPHDEKQGQQGVGNCPKCPVHRDNGIPNSTAPEVLRGGCDKRPYFSQFFVPCGKGRVQVVDYKVSDMFSPSFCVDRKAHYWCIFVGSKRTFAIEKNFICLYNVGRKYAR